MSCMYCRIREFSRCRLAHLGFSHCRYQGMTFSRTVTDYKNISALAAVKSPS
jgi:hypothetical protein